jgi:hypothetical protein
VFRPALFSSLSSRPERRRFFPTRSGGTPPRSHPEPARLPRLCSGRASDPLFSAIMVNQFPPSVTSQVTPPVHRPVPRHLLTSLLPDPHSPARLGGPLHSSPLFSHCSALFCPAQKVISSPFSNFRTLSAKHPGWAVSHSVPLPPFPPLLPLPLLDRHSGGRRGRPLPYFLNFLTSLLPYFFFPPISAPRPLATADWTSHPIIATVLPTRRITPNHSALAWRPGGFT